VDIEFGDLEEMPAKGWADGRQTVWLVSAWKASTPDEKRYFNVDPLQWQGSPNYREIIKTEVRKRMLGLA
jgi:hypothetical protein